MADSESLKAENIALVERDINLSKPDYGTKESKDATEKPDPTDSVKSGPSTEKKGPDKEAPKPPKKFRSNRYATKKTAGQGLMGVSLITSNTSQLKSTLDIGPHADYYILMVTLLAMSILLQMAVGVLLLIIGSRESKLEGEAGKGTKKTEKLNDISTFLMFLITMLNAALGAFTINNSAPSATPPTTTPPTVVNNTNYL